MSKHPDEFGTRMKEYEGVEAKRKFGPTLPVIARIDGRSFSKFTKPFNRPFDQRMANAMRATTKRLVEETHACIGYVQSDEISLIFKPNDDGGQIFFGGRIQKLTSVLAGMTTAFFIRALDHELMVDDDDITSSELNPHPHFDCRVWSVPTKMEAANTLLWRAQDARKNGISSACRSLNSAKSMNFKDQAAMVQMIADKGVDYYAEFSVEDRLGSYFQRKTYQTLLDDETWDKIPDKQKDGMCRVVTRSRVDQLDICYLGDVANRIELIFGPDALLQA
jgi:tRNA(His) guanylyltransferase